MRNFRELNVWKKSHDLTLEIYKITSAFPSDERFGLTSQIRRSASSVPTNLAEGCGREGDRELARFVSIALGSHSETEYHILLAFDLGLLSKEQYADLTEKVGDIRRMLIAFLRKVEAGP